jgi:hypothetical protein
MGICREPALFAGGIAIGSETPMKLSFLAFSDLPPAENFSGSLAYTSDQGLVVSDGKNWSIISGSTAEFSGCLLKKSTGQSIPNNTLNQFLTWDQEVYDTGYNGTPFHDTVTNNTRITVPAGVTKVRLSGQVDWGFGDNGYRIVVITKNGTSPGGYVGAAVDQRNAVIGGSTIQPLVTPVVDVEEGDYFELRVLHTAGVAVDVDPVDSTWFAIEVVGVE